MANPGYVRSTDGSDADNGSTWSQANATLAGAFTDAAAGDRIYVSDNHAETQASAMTLTSPGTAASPCEIVCGDDAAEPPTAVATSATISATAANNIAFNGFGYARGITFSAGSGTSNGQITFTSGSPWWWRFEACTLKLNGNNTNSRIQCGGNATTNDDGLLELIDCICHFSNASQGIVARQPFIWRGGSIAGTAPTTLFPSVSNGVACQRVLVENVDLSAISNSLVDASSAVPCRFEFRNCKLHASVAITTGSNAGQGGVEILLVNCDGADTNYRYRKHNYRGDEYHETTIVRTGGASDDTTSFSRKIVTSANAKFVAPYETEWIPVVCDDLTSTTLTVEIVTDNVTLTDGEAWLEVDYMGTSGFPLGVIADDAKADILASAANQATSTVTWTTTGLTTPVKQKLAVTFTPQEKGIARVRVCVAKASTTVYYCPEVDKT